MKPNKFKPKFFELKQNMKSLILVFVAIVKANASVESVLR